MSVKYDKDLTERAKARSAHLVTIDINGKFAKSSGVTGKVCVDSPEDVERCWEFFQWLVSDRKKKQS